MSPVFRHGGLRLYLLGLLEESPRHGYEVIVELENRFLGTYAPSAGTVYPRLAKLETEGLVAHREVDGRKVYALTDAGRAELAAHRAELAAVEQDIRTSVAQVAHELRRDVGASARDLREELTAAARSARRTQRATGRADWRAGLRDGHRPGSPAGAGPWTNGSGAGRGPGSPDVGERPDEPGRGGSAAFERELGALWTRAVRAAYRADPSRVEQARALLRRLDAELTTILEEPR